MGGRHARATEGHLPAVDPVGQDVHAGCGDVDHGAVVAEVGEIVVALVAVLAEVHLTAGEAALAVEVGERRHRDDFVVRRGYEARGVGSVVTGGGNHGHARAVRLQIAWCNALDAHVVSPGRLGSPRLMFTT